MIRTMFHTGHHQDRFQTEPPPPPTPPRNLESRSTPEPSTDRTKSQESQLLPWVAEAESESPGFSRATRNLLDKSSESAAGPRAPEPHLASSASSRLTTAAVARTFRLSSTRLLDQLSRMSPRASLVHPSCSRVNSSDRQPRAKTSSSQSATLNSTRLLCADTATAPTPSREDPNLR